MPICVSCTLYPWRDELNAILDDENALSLQVEKYTSLGPALQYTTLMMSAWEE